jgi:choline transport protein
MIFNGLLGFIMMLTVLFCIGDLETVLGTKTGFPFIQIFYDSVGSIAGATTMAAIVLALTWACAIGITTTASRMTWSFARTKVPVVAVGAVTLFSALLTLIYVGSATAFNDVISLTITGFYGSYFLPAAFLLYHRIKGHVASKDAVISNPMTEDASDPAIGTNPGIKAEDEKPTTAGDLNTNAGTPIVEVAQAALAWGPFRIPGILGIINNTYACLYMIFVIFWSVWPPETPVDATTMNYSVLVTGGVIIFSVVWYWVRGRREYEGPLIDDEVKAVMRMGSIVAI